MPALLQTKVSNNIFLRMHPLHRVVVSLGSALLVFLFIRGCGLRKEVIITILWDVFALIYILMSWVVFFKRPKAEIIKQANKDDGSRLFVLISIIITSFASMFTVLILMISADRDSASITLPISIAGMVFSWIMVHTLFSFHYAHMYYNDYNTKKNKINELNFPGDDEPDYLDFAYFSFVIGMTFQVSDVEINSAKIRRTVLAHGLLAFALNTFVVALTINLVAGLRK
ncbi:MAG: DUF1345 domain-containing protein [Ferruginibacter sp.]|nr:DUF1345 domain-containing protein [Ferruginibacter sp.]